MNFGCKYFISLIVLGVISFFSVKEHSFSWGFFAHKKINHMAVFTLPPEMINFYKQNIEFITEHAVDADKRRYTSKEEAPRHYIDIDHFVKRKKDLHSQLPQKWKEAVDKYTIDTLKEYGILPWHINLTVHKLTKAFEEKDIEKILVYSADLGHYVGDAHVPLHTTENYNGQLTGQHGIHAFWESRLPELKSEEYNYFVGKARYQDKVLGDIWKTVFKSFSAKDSVLEIEKKLSEEFPRDKKYSYETRGTSTKRVYSEEYSLEYHKRLNGMVERRLTRAILSVGGYWYTAWVNAGQPDLNELLSGEINTELKKQPTETNKTPTLIKGREHEE